MGQKVFIPVPKPAKDLVKWHVHGNSLRGKTLTKTHTFVLFTGLEEGGPADEFLDPLKANLTPKQAGQAFAPKRKAPKSREEPVTKQTMVIKVIP